MRGILPDVHATGYVRRFLRLYDQSELAEYWGFLNLEVVRFSDLGIAEDASDLTIWLKAQEEGLVLITGNRNQDGPLSLESAIRLHGSHESLPVITISKPHRVLQERGYANLAARKLLDYLWSIDTFRGAGRIYIP